MGLLVVSLNLLISNYSLQPVALAEHRLDEFLLLRHLQGLDLNLNCPTFCRRLYLRVSRILPAKIFKSVIKFKKRKNKCLKVRPPIFRENAEILPPLSITRTSCKK